jgi:transcriptional regulator with XRE-family HTH domain
MTTNNKVRRVASPIIKKILDETPPLLHLQIKNRIAIACRIYDLIKEQGYSYSSFASKLEKQPSVISKWLSGTHNFTMDTLDEIAFHLGVDTVFLMQAKPVQVVYSKTLEVVSREIKINRNYEANIQGQNRFQNNLNTEKLVNLPPASLTAKI